MSDKTALCTCDKEEIADYRDALNVIHEIYECISVTLNYILWLHKILYSHSAKSIGSKFKNVQNGIDAMGVDEKGYTLFTPMSERIECDLARNIASLSKNNDEANEICYSYRKYVMKARLTIIDSVEP